MKKARIVLASIALFTVIGGAFAFKAKSFTGSIYYVTTVKCNLATLAITAVTTNEIIGNVPYYYTLIFNREACNLATFHLTN